jgi:hypothetical protein
MSTRRLVFIKGLAVVFLLGKINNIFLPRFRYLNLKIPLLEGET